jgi:hypothetical protein
MCYKNVEEVVKKKLWKCHTLWKNWENHFENFEKYHGSKKIIKIRAKKILKSFGSTKDILKKRWKINQESVGKCKNDPKNCNIKKCYRNVGKWNKNERKPCESVWDIEKMLSTRCLVNEI